MEMGRLSNATITAQAGNYEKIPSFPVPSYGHPYDLMPTSTDWLLHAFTRAEVSHA